MSGNDRAPAAVRRYRFIDNPCIRLSKAVYRRFAVHSGSGQ